MTRTLPVVLLAGLWLAALCFPDVASARGGGHFGGGHFGGGHFGGGRFDARPEFRERDFRRPEEFRRPDEARRPEEEHRPAEDARRHDDGEHPAREEAREHREDADRHADDPRDLADRDRRQPANIGHWDRNQFWSNQWGAREFNCFNCRWGWAGGVFWPFALGDVFSYAWWPYAGTPAFWNYGLNYILTGIFWPYGAYEWPEGYGTYAWSGDAGSYEVAREVHQDVYSAGPRDGSDLAQTPESATDIAQSCSGFAPGVGGLPLDRIAAAVKPTESQRPAFDQLKAASAKAETLLKSACPSQPPLTPVGRLDALQKRLEAMDQAVDTLEGPLAAFSSALSEEQRKALDGLGSTSDNGSAMAMGDVGRCIDEGQEFVDLPAQEIAQSVQPDAKQNAALDQLETASTQAAERLRSQCPTSIPKTVEARLAAMDQRLHETIVAVNEVRPALLTFYDSLTDEQKARFNTLPPAQASKTP